MAGQQNEGGGVVAGFELFDLVVEQLRRFEFVMETGIAELPGEGPRPITRAAVAEDGVAEDLRFVTLEAYESVAPELRSPRMA